MFQLLPDDLQLLHLLLLDHPLPLQRRSVFLGVDTSLKLHIIFLYFNFESISNITTNVSRHHFLNKNLIFRRLFKDNNRCDKDIIQNYYRFPLQLTGVSFHVWTANSKFQIWKLQIAGLLEKAGVWFHLNLK